MRPLLLLALLAACLLPSASAVQVEVFRDNPIVALRDPAFRDNPASLDDPAFDGALMTVELPEADFAQVLGGPLLYPSNPTAWGNSRIVIADGLGLPDGSVERRDDPRFLELMVFVYTDHALARLEALGYTQVTAEGPVHAFAHDPPAFRGGIVPSPSLYPDAYVPSQRQMHFMYRAPSPEGQGGMGSSAEDAEIVLHELGHIVHVRMAPQVEYVEDWFGRWAEGVGDLFAALLMEEFSQGYGDACISEWLLTYYPDGFDAYESEGLRCIRALDGDVRWPDDEYGEVHRDSQAWSQAMWTVRQQIGANDTLRLLLESFPLMPKEIGSFQDIGHAFLLADLALFGGRDEALLRSAFAEHGIALSSLAELAPTGADVPEPLVAVAAASSSAAPTSPPAAKESPGASAVAAGALLAGAAVLRRARRQA